MGRRCSIVLVVLVLAPSTAHADSVVFRRGGDVWRMAPDGTEQRQLTSGVAYEWPSAADDGTVVAAGPDGVLHRFTALGAELNAIPTAATVDDEESPSETPTHVRVSPDGTKIAYDQAIDGDVTTLWTTADATAPVLTGQDGFVAPSWIGSGKLLLSRDISFDPEALGFSVYTLGGSAVSWFSDTGAPWATGFDPAAARSGARVAVIANDAAETGGIPSRVVLRLFEGTALRCELPLETAETYDAASPSFSPDGSRLAWAESDGIHVATLGALDDCAAIRQQVVTLPGAWEPYWTPSAMPVPVAAPRLVLRVKVRARPYRTTVRKRGIAARVTVSAPATVRVTIGKRSVVRKFADAGTRTIRVRVRVAKRYVVRVSAPGAAPVSAVVRPR